MKLRLSIIVDTVRIVAYAACGTDGKFRISKIKLENSLMADNPAIATFVASVTANFAKIQAGITALDNQINAFNNSPGTLSTADQASLDAIVASSGALATAAAGPVVPPTPVPATPAA